MWLTDRIKLIFCNQRRIVAIWLLIGAIFLWGILITNFRQGVDLHNGWRFQILAIDVGQVKYSQEMPLKELLRDEGPDWMASILGDPVDIDQKGDPDDLMVAFRIWAPGQREFDGDKPLNVLFELIGSDGVQFQNHDCFWGHDGERLDFYESHKWENYPRRDPQLRLNVRDPKSEKLLTEMTIPNPGYRPAWAEWKAQSLPAKEDAGPLSLTLTGVSIDKARHRLEPHFKVDTTDPQWMSPRLSSVFSDVTGNHGDWLSPTEPAWKVKVTAFRRLDVVFLPKQTWKFPVNAIPAGQVFVPFDEVQSVGGIQIKPLWVFGSGDYRIQSEKVVSALAPKVRQELQSSILSINVDSNIFPIRYEIFTEVPGVLIQHSWLDPQTRLEVRVRDQRWRNLRSDSLPDHHLTTLGEHSSFWQWIPFRPLADSKSCDIEIVVHKCLEFEFIIKPPLPEATDPDRRRLQ